jgi:hypothetical protein
MPLINISIQSRSSTSTRGKSRNRIPVPALSARVPPPRTQTKNFVYPAISPCYGYQLDEPPSVSLINSQPPALNGIETSSQIPNQRISFLLYLPRVRVQLLLKHQMLLLPAIPPPDTAESPPIHFPLLLGTQKAHTLFANGGLRYLVYQE